MQFIHTDLGYRQRGEIVEVTLSSGANVRLMDSSNFSSYKSGRSHRYAGGLARRSPVRLAIPHLVVISYDDPLGRIMRTYKRLGRHAQVTLLVGDHLGDFKTLVDQYLPKPAIDRTTFRMAELLKSRWGAQSDLGKGSSNGHASVPSDEEALVS